MAYNKFTLEKVTEQFGLKVIQKDSIFAAKDVALPQPSQLLKQTLERNVTLAKSIATEKALSEFIVAPILSEILNISNKKISLFSGIDFTIDIKQGLSGRCDFIISLNDNQYFLTAPVITIVEAKKSDISLGLGQCVAEMVAAQIFNVKKNIAKKRIYGIVTTGLDWQILSLEDKNVYIENRVLTLNKVEEILGILLKMVEANI